MTPITQVLSACALSAVIVTAIWQSSSSGTSVGSFVAFVAAMLMLIAPIKHLSEVTGPITRGLVAIERGVALVEDTPVERSGGFDPGRARGHVELRGVSLRYPNDQNAASATSTSSCGWANRSRWSGRRGAGKSTLVNLLPRFIEPTAGSVLLDGRDLADWNVEALRRQFALVSQDVVLFNDSVAANVALGGVPDRQRVEDALRAANLFDFVRALPDGIDSLIGHNGSQMSGGQRQRLAIPARSQRRAIL